MVTDTWEWNGKKWKEIKQEKPKEEKLRIRGWIDQAEAQLGPGKDWELAKYGLVSWIDEMMISDSLRYGGAFTPPSGPYAPDADTDSLGH